MIFIIDRDGNVSQVEVGRVSEGYQLNQRRKNDEKSQPRVTKGMQHLFPKKHLHPEQQEAHYMILMLNFLWARLKITTA
jgi:hypothetical protein